MTAALDETSCRWLRQPMHNERVPILGRLTVRELTTDEAFEVEGEAACINGAGALVGGPAGPAAGACIGGGIAVALNPCRCVRALLRSLLGGTRFWNELARGEKIMKFPGIDQRTFAICVCCLAVTAASSDSRIWPLLCAGAVVVATARFADTRRKRIQKNHTSH